MYWKDKWDFKESIEYEYKFAGRYGAKGEKRQKKKKATPEQIKKQNQINREKKMRRLIKANFRKNDIWACLKYPQGTKKPMKEVKKDLGKFLRRMRDAYRKCGVAFKFVYRIEIGKRGGIHVHILVNRKPGADILIQERWQQGRVNFENIYESGGYQALAEYIVKEPDEEATGQIVLFGQEEKKELVKYSSSRNLVRPEPERKTFYRRTMKKILAAVRSGDGPDPSPGYYIDRDSVHVGLNRFTGYSYLQYTEYRIQNRKEGGSPWIE